MFGLFKKDPAKKLEKEIKKKLEQSVEVQRNGDLRKYGALIKEIEDLQNELEILRSGG